MTNPLIQILDRHPEYTRLRDAMVNGEGPAGVFGLGESHKGHIAAALSTGRAVLLVAPNEVAAVKLHDDIACYDIPCAHFPTREIPLSGKGFAARDSIEERRVAVLSALAAGKTMTVQVPENSGFWVYDGNGQVTASSVLWGDTTVTLPEDGTIVFAGDPGARFHLRFQG